MTVNMLLEELKNLTIDATKNFKLPTQIQKGDTENQPRAPEVHKNRLPNSRDYKKIAPYVLIQAESGGQRQAIGEHPSANANVFFTFVTYSENEEEGTEMLLNVMDAVRIRLLKQVVVGRCFELDVVKGLEFLIFREDTAPFYTGVLVGTFSMPPIEREVPRWPK